MAITDLFSKRQRRERGETPDVYQYEDVPHALRVQLVHIFRDAMGDPNSYGSSTVSWLTIIHDTLCREHGVFTLGSDANLRGGPHPSVDVYHYLLEQPNVLKVIDVVELFMRVVDDECRTIDFQRRSLPRVSADDAINEVNVRFREHGVGFQYESRMMVRVDSQILHESAVREALHLLQDPTYAGANQEFLRAHEHYRHGRFPGAISEALKSFESVLKSICQKRHWSYQHKDTAKALINIVLQNHLIPMALQTQFSSLQQMLESGVPAVRNNFGGHGQGPNPVSTPSYLAAYQLHITASSILLLVEAERSSP